MAGKWARIKKWIGNENLNSADVNAEFDNVITNAASDKISGASNDPATLAGMQATSNPGGVGSENVPVTIQDEVRQLRYQLIQIAGGAQWYSPPAASLSSLNTNIGNFATLPTSRINSGRKDANNQPMFLVPDGTAPTLRFKAASTSASVYTNGNLRTVSADLSLTALTTAFSSNNTCLVNDSTLAGAQSTKTQGERGTVITIGTIGSNITALNGQYAAFKVSTEYFIAEVDTTNNRLKNCFRGVGFDSTDAWKSRVAISNGNTITLMKLAYIFLEYSSGFALGVTYNKPTIAYTSPASPAIGDRWYDLTNSTWKNYSGAAWVAIEATFAGYAICDSANCVAARSTDFFKIWNSLNTVELEYVGTNSVRVTRLGTKINVNGTTYSFDNTQPSFSTSTNLDSGVSLSASTTYYCYITDLGDVKISDVAPTERKYDILGGYHPAKPWRAVGEFGTDTSSNILSTSILLTNYFDNQLPANFVALTQQAPSTLQELYRKNFIANSAFDFWQRGATPPTVANSASGYGPDRWYAKNSLGTNGVITMAQLASTLNGSLWDCSVKISTAPTAAQANGCEFYQTLENITSLQLYGQSASFQVSIKALGNVNQVGVQFFYKTTEAKVDTAIGTEQTFTVSTGSYTTCSIYNQAIGTTQTTSGVVGIRIRITGVSAGNTYDINNGFVVGQAMMNLGSVPATFQRMFNSVSAEVNYLERFYEKSLSLTQAPGTITATTACYIMGVANVAAANGNMWSFTHPRFRVNKRATPTVTLYDGDNSATTGRWSFTATGTVNNSAATANTTGFVITNATGGTVTPTAGLAWGHFTADAEI